MVRFRVVGSDTSRLLGTLRLREPRGGRFPEDTAVPIGFLSDAERERLEGFPARQRRSPVCRRKVGRLAMTFFVAALLAVDLPGQDGHAAGIAGHEPKGFAGVHGVAVQ